MTPVVEIVPPVNTPDAIINRMIDEQRPIIRTSSNADLAFAVVVLASYFAMFSGLTDVTPLQILLIMTLGIAYMVIGIYGYAFCARSTSLFVQLAYFAIQIPLGGTIVYLGKGAGLNILLLLPLAGHGVILLPSKWLYPVNLAILCVYAVAVDLYSQSIEVVWANLPTFIAGLIFIMVFTQMAVSEEKARKEVEHLNDDLSAANQRLREFNIRVEELAITQERNRVAREIHDGLGHYLTTIHMQIQAAQALLPQDIPHAKEALNTAQIQAQEALVDVRRSVASLRAAVDEGLPLQDSIKIMLENYSSSGIQVDFQLQGLPKELPPQVQHTFYRAAQECLNNVRKHAQARRVWVTLDFSVDHTLRMAVRDDGIGADRLEGGFGLLGIKERVTYLNGKMSTQTSAGNGFSILIEAPI